MRDVKGWNEVLNKVQVNLDKYEQNFDKPLKSQLEQIYIKDQTLRQIYTDAEAKFGKESEEMDYFWSLMTEQDSLNEIEIIRIIDREGWVGKTRVGGKANMTLWLVIQHADLEIQEKYAPLMKASVLKEESSGQHFAMLEDRIQMRNGKPQIYGTQITIDSKTGEQVVYKVWKPQYVNQRRKEVGLGPIEAYVKRWEINWDIEQKEK